MKDTYRRLEEFVSSTKHKDAILSKESIDTTKAILKRLEKVYDWEAKTVTVTKRGGMLVSFDEPTVQMTLLSTGKLTTKSVFRPYIDEFDDIEQKVMEPSRLFDRLPDPNHIKPFAIPSSTASSPEK